MTGEMLSTAQAARVLGLSRDRVVQLANQERLLCVRTPIGRLFPASEVAALAERRSEERAGARMLAA